VREDETPARASVSGVSLFCGVRALPLAVRLAAPMEAARAGESLDGAASTP
jgi:hypothetical protein